MSGAEMYGISVAPFVSVQDSKSEASTTKSTPNKTEETTKRTTKTNSKAKADCLLEPGNDLGDGENGASVNKTWNWQKETAALMEESAK